MATAVQNAEDYDFVLQHAVKQCVRESLENLAPCLPVDTRVRQRTFRDGQP